MTFDAIRLVVEQAALRALVAAALARDDLVWRHHGIGVLQAYIRENVEPEVRIHLWHPDLVRPGIGDAGSVHDHRFDLVSTVVHGSIVENVLHEDSHFPHGRMNAWRAGSWQPWHVQNARAAGAERGFDGECHPIGAPIEALAERRLHVAGDTYTLGRHVFHETVVDELAITVCTMFRKEGQARLLVPVGKEPVHAFGGPLPIDAMARVFKEARAALEVAG